MEWRLAIFEATIARINNEAVDGKMKIIVYTPHYSEKQTMVLSALAEGIPNAVLKDLREYEPCDVAVIFGLVKEAYKETWLKREILRNHYGRKLIVVESAFVRRGEYWAVGWGGIHGQADFNVDGRRLSLDRFLSFELPILPWVTRKTGPVVVCGQLPRDTNVQYTDHVKWCQTTVEHFHNLKHKVFFRPHPRIDDPEVYGVPGQFWDFRKLASTLKGTKCIVIYNSTSGVDAAIAGIPIIACDSSAMAYPIATHMIGDNFPNVAQLRRPDRSQWFANLGYSQWNLEEMRSGQVWEHLNASSIGEKLSNRQIVS